MTVEYLAGKRVKGLSTERVLLMSATGGTITTNGNYKIHSFTNTGNTNFVVTGSGTAEILLVGGGGTSSWRIDNTAIYNNQSP